MLDPTPDGRERWRVRVWDPRRRRQAPRSKSKCGSVASSWWAWAVQHGHVAANVAAKMTNGWGVPARGRVIDPSIEGVEAMAGPADEYWAGAGDIIWAFAAMGLRWEEGAGCRRDYVDVERRRLSVARICTESGGRGRSVRWLTKTEAGHRDVIMPDAIEPIVTRLLERDDERHARWLERRAWQLAQAAKPDVRTKQGLPSDWEAKDERRLISSPKGGFLSYSTWRRVMTHARANGSGLDHPRLAPRPREPAGGRRRLRLRAQREHGPHRSGLH